MIFEKFAKIGNLVMTPTISIYKSGQIVFNSSIIQQYQINKKKYAEIYFNEETNQIGIIFTLYSDDGGNKLYFDSTRISFSAIAFLKFHEIDYTKLRKYNIKYDKNNEMFIIDLNNPHKRKEK